MTIEELKNSLIKDIKKTGYPTELHVGSKFLMNKWKIEENVYFIDKDKNKGREIDLITYKNKGSKNHNGIYVWTFLIIEIKKSEKPWVIFSTKRKEFFGGGYALLNVPPHEWGGVYV